MRMFYVCTLTKSVGNPVESGPFASRQEAERLAVELAKRSDVQPQIRIVARELPDDGE